AAAVREQAGEVAVTERRAAVLVERDQQRGEEADPGERPDVEVGAGEELDHAGEDAERGADERRARDQRRTRIAPGRTSEAEGGGLVREARAQRAEEAGGAAAQARVAVDVAVDEAADPEAGDVDEVAGAGGAVVGEVGEASDVDRLRPGGGEPARRVAQHP